jgi:hypothetical protein
MMIHFRSIFLFIICLLLACNILISQEKINVKAKSRIENDNNFNARKNALQKCYETAIEKVILKVIPEQLLLDNKAKISDEIYKSAKNFIRDEEIIDEDVVNGEYVINADITIDKKRVQDALNSLSIAASSGEQTEMNMAVAVDEILYNQNGQQVEIRTGSKSLISSQISEGLLKQKYNLKSEDIIEKIRNEIAGPGGNLSGLLTGGKTDDVKAELASKMISGEYKIDAVVFGLTKINQTGKDKQGFFTATASTNIRVIETATGNLLASAVSNETGIAKSENEAAAAAARRLGDVVSRKIITQLTQKWLDLLNTGSYYQLNFKGIKNAGMRENLLKLLMTAGISKLVMLKEDFNSGILSLKAIYKGKPATLKEKIFQKLYSDPEFSGISEEMVTGNTLSYKINESIKKRGLEKENAPPVSFEKPSIRAVIIGVSKYADESMNLNSAAADAQIVKDYFSSKDGLNISSEKIKYITDKDATKVNVIKTIKDMFSTAGENDLLILYFAGHGWAEEKEMYFLGHDTNKDDLIKTAISQKDIQTALSSSPARRQIFIADACHSGATSLAYMTYVASGSNDFPTTRNVDPRANFIRNVIGSSTGLAVITAASANQQSQEGEQWGGGHGIFTWTLLQGLKGEADLNKDKVITINEAFIYSIIKMSQETEGKQTPTAQGPLDLPLGVLK